MWPKPGFLRAPPISKPESIKSPDLPRTRPCRGSIRRVFNDCDFGGYPIANGVAPLIDGRTEFYGEKFFVEHHNASGLMEPESLFRLLEA
jgi:hypothetical protein